MVPAQLLQFLGVVAVITVTPGPDTALVVRNTLQGGRRHGLLTAVGCSTGLLIWGALSSLGLATAFRASSALFVAIRIAGGVYLVWLGIRMLASGWNVDAELRDVGGLPAGRRHKHRPLLEGLLTDLLNPKAAAFFTALLPQFLTSNDPVLATTLLYAAIAAAAALAGLMVYACAAAQARLALGRPSIRPLFDRVTGLVLVGLGIRMLTREAR
jgi:threonine/homoserine/homoserine lactone efflux protein